MTDERDLHDPTLDAAWRAQAQDAPPRALDDAILAAAHRAVQSAPRAAGAPAARWKAWAPLAVAATLGAIALGVLQLAPHEEDATRSVVSDAPVASMEQRAQTERQATATSPAPQPAPPPAAQPAPPPAGEPAPAPARPAASKPEVAQRRLQAPAPAAGGRFAETPTDKLSKQRDETVKEEGLRSETKLDRTAQERSFQARKDAAAAPPQPFPAAPPPPPASVAASPPASVAAAPPAAAPAPAPLVAPAPAARVGGLTAGASGGSASRSSGALNAQSAAPMAERERDAATGRSRDAGDVRAKVATTRTPDDFIGEIHRLRAEGRDADAALALAAFRAAYPDADERLPVDLRAWARGVPRP